jgi:transcriptional antiterminator NusG
LAFNALSEADGLQGEVFVTDDTENSADHVHATHAAAPVATHDAAASPSDPAPTGDPTHSDDPSAHATRVTPADVGSVGNALGDPALDSAEVSTRPGSEPAPTAQADGSAVGNDGNDDVEDDDEPYIPPEPEEPAVPKGPLELIETQVGPTGNRDWYILKVQSNREDSIRDALERKIAIAGLKDYFGEIIVPVEHVTEFKNGKKRVVRRKLYPGYIVVSMELNDDTWYLVRDTHGIGDFTGAGGKPSPMPANEIAKIISKQEEKTEEAPKLKIKFVPGDRVKITEGTFENFEGDVDGIDQTNGRVTVMINIFGRSTPVELEYWQIESV